MCEAIQKRRSHLCISEDLGPLREAEVGCYDDAGPLIEFTEQMEQQRTAGRAERQIAKFVEDDQVDLGKHLGHFPSLSESLFLLQCVDEFYCGVEAHFASVMLYGLNADSRGDMAFASSRPANQNSVFRILYELTAMELPDCGLIDVARREVKTCEIFV